MPFTSAQIVPLIVGTGFAAGLNVYAMLATLGILARTHVVRLPSSLTPIESWWVIVPALVFFLGEFIGDKIPAFDLLWNALHTFIRIPVAALVAYAASSGLPPQTQMLCAALGGTLALVAHGGKTAARAGITPSPEPFSNIALSLGEDVLAVLLTWAASEHPYIAAAIVLVLVVLVILVIRWVIRALVSLFRRSQKTISAYIEQHSGSPAA